MFSYSIIIPHKNIPDLLQRCLDSIPQRKDIEIIVVDDNSDSEKVDFDAFPGLDRQDVTVVFCKQSGGAGAARNKGLEKASGQWLLFADSDDFFTNEFLTALDSCKSSDSDVILFKTTSCLSSDISKPSGRAFYNDNVDHLIAKEGIPREILLKSVSPWAKMYRRDFIEKNQIRFEEVKYANDVFWISQVAVNACKITGFDFPLYCVTTREGSLVAIQDENALMTRYEVSRRNHAYLVSHGLKEYDTPFAIEWLTWARRLGLTTYLRFLQKAIADHTFFSSRVDNESRFNYKHPYLYALIILLRN